MIANLMHVAGVNHVITIDLHASQMQGFFKCPVDNLVAEPILARWIRTNVKDWKEAVVVSKNPGGTKRVTSLADALKLSFGIVTTDRRRPHPGNSMFNSVIFDSVTPVEILARSDPHIRGGGAAGGYEEYHDAQTHEENNGGNNGDPIEHDFAPHPENSKASDHSNSETPGSFLRRPGKVRATTSLAPGVANRMGNNGSTISPSPLAQSIILESTPTSPRHSIDEDMEDEASGAAPLQRVHSAIATTNPTPDSDLLSDEDADEYTDEVCCYSNPFQGTYTNHSHSAPAMSSLAV